jgi:general secretion pathway protein D
METAPSATGAAPELTSAQSVLEAALQARRSGENPDSSESTAEGGIQGPTLYEGTDQLVRLPKAQEPVRFLGEDVSLNFEQAPLTEVVHAVMGDILQLDYIVEHPIIGEVTLRTRTPVPRDELLDILESLLKANNALMIRDSEGRYFVSGSGQMSKLQPSVAASASSVSGFSTVIIPLRYISAASMAEILRPVAEETAFVRVDNLRNILMLAGTRAQLSGWQDIINTFDVDMLKGMSVGIFPIENGSLEEVETALSALLGKGAGEGEAEGLAGIGSAVRLVPVPRLSSLLVVTPRAHYLKRIETWIKRLDKAPDANYERQLYVYEVQNSSAEHLATLLSTVFGGTGKGSGSRSGVAPGMTPERVTGSGSESQSGSSSSGASGSSYDGPSNFSVGDVRVVADDANNALLIYATGKEYRKIEPALKRLDIPATQVIIEASIVEVTLDDELRYGLNWTFNDGLNGGYSGIGQLFGGPTVSEDGFSYSVINSDGVVKAVLNALASKNLLNVISSPSVMVLDNQTATIQVGNQFAVAGNAVATGDTVTRSVSYRDTGVQLTVTPSVNAGGMVTMEVEQAVTDINESEAATVIGNDSLPSFLERKITSRVAVRSGESIVLGGLILENKSRDSKGVPLLHQIPVLGALFGGKSSVEKRTELLVVITPRAIYNDAELREVSNEMRSQLRGLELIDMEDTSAFLSDPKRKENLKPKGK